MKQPNEEELRRLAREHCAKASPERQEETFRAFYDACKHAVLRIAVHLTGNREYAQDLSQEIWLKLWKHLCSFRGESKMVSWVYRIGLTTYLDKKLSLFTRTNREQLRKECEQQSSSSSSPSEFEAVSRTLADTDLAANPEVQAESATLSIQIEAALQRLTPAERTIFTAKHYSELTFKEIAAEIGVTEGTVKTLHFRALKKLQVLLVSTVRNHTSEANTAASKQMRPLTILLTIVCP